MRAADLSLAQAIAPDAPVAGAPVTYTLTAANDGPGPATGVEITDPLPAQLVVTDIHSAPAASLCAIEAGNVLRCRFDGLGNGAAATVTVVGALPRDASGTLVNTARVGAEEDDPDPGDNAATLERPIGPPAPEPAGNRSEATTQVVAATAAPVRRRERRQDAGRVGRPLRGGLRLRTTAAAGGRGRASSSATRCASATAPTCARGRSPCATGCRRRLTFVRARGGRFRAGRVCWTRPRLRRGRTWTVTLVARVDPDARGGSIRNVARVRAANLAARRDGARTRVGGEPAATGRGDRLTPPRVTIPA